MSNVETIDRVLVMSNRPATIQEIIDVDLPRPGYLEKRNRIFRVIGMSLRVGEIAV
jgi:ABC-type nitrate/sulfonate/bicarbonate transport system ATPase subunit